MGQTAAPSPDLARQAGEFGRAGVVRQQVWSDRPFISARPHLTSCMGPTVMVACPLYCLHSVSFLGQLGPLAEEMGQPHSLRADGT